MKTTTWGNGMAVMAAMCAGLFWASPSQAQTMELPVNPDAWRAEPPWTGHANLLLGARKLSHAWAPVDTQYVIGVDFDAKPPHWPVNLAAQFLFSGSDNIPSQPGAGGGGLEIYQLNLGLRKYWQPSPWFEMFAGGGFSMVYVSVDPKEINTGEVDDNGDEIVAEGPSTRGGAVGYWVGAGCNFNIREHVHVGVQIEYSSADVNLFGNRMDAGGTCVMLTFGWQW